MQWSSWSKHVFERDDSHAISCAISRQEKGGLHKCIARFITYSSPWRADTWFPSLPRKECTGVRYVITKFSRMDGLPNFLTHGASLARFARRSSANIFGKGVSSSSSVLRCWHPFCIHSFYHLFYLVLLSGQLCLKDNRLLRQEPKNVERFIAFNLITKYHLAIQNLKKSLKNLK